MVYLEKRSKSSHPLNFSADGLRTPVKKGFFEWWYFDCHSEDGTYIGIVFFKSLSDIKLKITPFISVRFKPPHEELIYCEQPIALKECHFNSRFLDLNFNNNTVFYDEESSSYHIKLQLETTKLSVDLKIHSQSKPWQPESGKWLFGPHQEKFFSWFVAMPHGKGYGNIKYNSKS